MQKSEQTSESFAHTASGVWANGFWLDEVCNGQRPKHSVHLNSEGGIMRYADCRRKA